MRMNTIRASRRPGREEGSSATETCAKPRTTNCPVGQKIKKYASGASFFAKLEVNQSEQD